MEEPKGTEQTTILTDFNFENIIFKVIPYFLSHSLSSVKYANNPMMAAMTTKNLIIALPFKIVAPFCYTQCIMPCSVTILLIRWSNASIGIGVSHNCIVKHTPINVLGESSLRNRS